jgi:hypothetical protein
MEAADPFADAAPAAEIEDDPFAQADAPATAEPPVVDREGQQVPAEQPVPPVEDPAQAPAAPPAEQPPEPPAAPAPEPPAAPAPAPDPAPEPPAAPAAPQEAPQQPQEGQQGEAPAAAEAAEEPPAAEGSSDKQIRHYKVMFQTAQNQWTEASLDEPPEGVKVVTIDGLKFMEARNNEHALKLAYAVIGAPREGATIWPVPRGGFKPKRVKPAAPKPERERLEIS